MAPKLISKNLKKDSKSELLNLNKVKNTIKKYLYGHVRSNFLRVDFDEAALAVMLPVQRFVKGQPY